MSENGHDDNDQLRDRPDEALQASSFLGSVLSSIQQGVVVVDRNMQVVAWSHRATELWGLRDDDVEGEHLLNLDIGIPVQRLRDPIRQILAGVETAELELDGHDRRGKDVHVRITFAPLHNRHESEERDGAILLVSAERAQMGRRRVFKTAALTEVNAHILDAARDSITQEQVWDFFCECGQEDCAEHVRLSIDEYVGLRETGAPVLAPGHRLSRSEQGRRRAGELREESQALQAQANHEVRRLQERKPD